MLDPQTMDIADMAIYTLVCQKSDFHGNCDVQNYQKLNSSQILAKKLCQNMQALQRFFVQEFDLWYITKVDQDVIMLFGLF